MSLIAEIIVWTIRILLFAYNFLFNSIPAYYLKLRHKCLTIYRKFSKSKDINNSQSPTKLNYGFEALSELGYEYKGFFGHGFFGGTFGMEDNLGQLKTVKVLHLVDDRWDREMIQTELKAYLLGVCHPNVVRVDAVLLSSQWVFVVMEWVQGGRALSLIGYKTTEDLAQKWFKQICQALLYLHRDLKMPHRNIKPSNILIDANGNAKLTDTSMTTVYYCYEDILNSTEYLIDKYGPFMTPGGTDPFKADIWALGMLLYMMLTRQTERHRKVTFDYSSNMRNLKWDELPEGTADLIKKMLARNESDRIDICQVLQNEWVTRYSEHERE